MSLASRSRRDSEMKTHSRRRSPTLCKSGDNGGSPVLIVQQLIAAHPAFSSASLAFLARARVTSCRHGVLELPSPSYLPVCRTMLGDDRADPYYAVLVRVPVAVPKATGKPFA